MCLCMCVRMDEMTFDVPLLRDEGKKSSILSRYTHSLRSIFLPITFYAFASRNNNHLPAYNRLIARDRRFARPLATVVTASINISAMLAAG